MSDLATRKRRLLAEADLHRQLIGLEYLHVRGRCDAARTFIERHRWWLLGGAIVAGVLLARHGRVLGRWLPTVLATYMKLSR